MGDEDVRGEDPVGNRMRQNAIGKAARAHGPPVVSDSSKQSHFPIGSVLGRKEGSDDPEGAGDKRSEGYFAELGLDEPTHQPAAPEELFEDGNEERGAGGAHEDKR